MTSLLTDDFYEHLHKLEELRTTQESWVTRVSDDNKDLKWCQAFIHKTLYPYENRESFANILLQCYQDGYDNVNKIGKHLDMHHTTVKQRIEELELNDFYESLYMLYHGVIMQRSEDGQSWFMRNRQTGAEFIGFSDRRALGPMIIAKKEKRGFKAYRARDWKETHPDFTLPLEEVLHNEIIKIEG